MIHFRSLYAKGLWGRSFTELPDAARVALRDQMEYDVLVLLKHFGFDVSDDALGTAFKAAGGWGL